MQPALRIHIYSSDHELRTWIADELVLISPTAVVHASDSVAALEASPAELLIVGIDGLSLADAERLRDLVELRRSAPVIAIGAPCSALATTRFAALLDAMLTSKQLKRAVRETLARKPAPA